MEINLPIPYISQFDPQANEDPADNCGPSCVAMILKFFGETATVNDVFQKTGAPANSPISIDQLMKAIGSYGYSYSYQENVPVDSLKAQLQKNIPAIVLVHAGDLLSREDQGFKGGHFIVIDGFRADGYFCNDPDFWGQYRQDGDHHFYTKAEFERAWSDNAQDGGNPNNAMLVINPKSGTLIPAGGGLPANYADIVHGSSQWDAAVAKYIPSSDPVHTDFPALQQVVAGFQSNTTAAQNKLDQLTKDKAVSDQEVQNYQEKLALSESQRQQDEKMYSAEIDSIKSSSSPSQKFIDSLKGQVTALQGQVTDLTNQKHDIANQLAVCQSGSQNQGWFILLLAKLFGKKG